MVMNLQFKDYYRLEAFSFELIELKHKPYPN